MENNFNITAASVSDRGLSDKRPENEDSFLVLEERGVYAVADGVGGAQAGDVASQMAVEILGEAFINQSQDHDAEDVMRLAIERANSAIHQMANDLPQLASMATTIVALHLNGSIATIGHVGDSRAYRLDHNGNLLRETHDHSVVEEEVRAGRMTAEQAAHHPSKNVISRALGAEEDVEIDLKTIMVEPGTTFLLCSDGVTRHIDDAEIGGLLENSSPESICDRVKEICYARGAEDNLTAVVVRVAGERAKEFSSAAVAGDGEEPTIASARSPFDSPAQVEAQEVFSSSDTVPINEDEDAFANGDTVSIGNEDVFSTSDTIAIDNLDDGSYLMDETDEIREDDAPVDLGNYSSSSVIVPASPMPATETAYVAAPSQMVDDRSPSSISKVLSAVLFLLLGSVIGAGAYYFWLSSQPEAPVAQTPVLTEMKSNNVPLTGFEEGRRLVDKDPAKYILANAASPQIAEDYFLLGRAFLLTGKYWEAKRAFVDARNKLATADPNNANTLASEISMALAIIESPQATESFAKDLSTANASSNTSANSNSNASANMNTLPAR
ncbi:MAG: hypothetical protein DMF63_17650 [Acidobacteria bacterium]|nr:MAG: hypothetical protein DMF63_17650 [Acidobacteriota bacterium]